MGAIFISYRREDTEGQAGRLFDDLVEHFGEDSVFMDVAGIAPGSDFRRVIDEHMASCGVVLAMIGKQWLDAKDDSGRIRLEDPADFVRLETASALKRDIPVIPVLVHGASMPRPAQLPADLAELAYRNSVELTHARWDSDVQVLIKALRTHVPLIRGDASSAKTVPVRARRRTAGAEAVHPSGESGVWGSAQAGAARSRRPLFAIVVTSASAAAIAVALGGYVAHERYMAYKQSEKPVVAGTSAAERMGVVKTGSLSSKLEKTLMAALLDFQKYCSKVGFILRPGMPTLHVEDIPLVDGKPVNMASFYDPNKQEFVVATQFASDPTFVFHEYMHWVLLPPESTTLSKGYLEMESGLACYYPASFRTEPNCGLFSLSDRVLFSAPFQLNRDAGPWPNALWELRGIIGKETCDRLLVKVWNKLDPHGANESYARYVASQILAAYSESGGRDDEKIRALFSVRGLGNLRVKVRNAGTTGL